MSASLLIGAGAEVAPPYKIPNGQDFIWATCYTYNKNLCDALEKYYEPILAGAPESANLPRTYQSSFLYESNNASFRDLIKGILIDPDGVSLLERLVRHDCHILPTRKNDEPNLSDDDYSLLFELLIKQAEQDSDAVSKLKDHLLEDLPADAFFGIIEKYFSSFLEPRKRNKAFWKLVNYYWSAYFAVASPLIQSAYGTDKRLETQGLYSFTLNNIAEVTHKIFQSDFIQSYQNGDEGYYAQMSGLFDYAMTTNYTPFCRALNLKNPHGKCIHLAGSLSQFESIAELRVYDLTKESAPSDAFLIPFIMTQVPVKPIIDFRQIEEYACAAEAIRNSTTLVVLGYSLSPNDAHICSLVQEHLYKNANNRLVYLDYCEESDDCVTTSADILRRIRACDTHKGQIEVVHFGKKCKLTPEDLRPYLISTLPS